MVKKDLMAFVAKVEDGKKFIRISDFYESNCTGEEFVAVSDEVLETLVTMKREEKRREEYDYRHLTAFGYDDTKASELLGITEVSPEQQFIKKAEIEDMKQAMKKLDKVSRRRFYEYYALGMKLWEIAEKDNVSETAVFYNIQNTLKKLRRWMSM